MCTNGKCKKNYVDSDIASVVWRPLSSLTKEFEDNPISSKVWKINLISGQTIIIETQHYTWIDEETQMVNISGNFWCPICEHVFAGVSYCFSTNKVPLYMESVKKCRERLELLQNQSYNHNGYKGGRGRGR